MGGKRNDAPWSIGASWHSEHAGTRVSTVGLPRDAADLAVRHRHRGGVTGLLEESAKETADSAPHPGTRTHVDSYFPPPPSAVLRDNEASGRERHPDTIGARYVSPELRLSSLVVPRLARETISVISSLF